MVAAALPPYLHDAVISFQRSSPYGVYRMRARLIAPALAIAGFVLTLEVVSWQNGVLQLKDGTVLVQEAPAAP